MSTIFVTGGAGFIGSEIIRQIIKNTKQNVVNIDKLTYAGNLDSLNSIKNNNRYFFEVKALLTILNKGIPGESYCIGGKCEKTNIEIVNIICEIMDQMRPLKISHKNLIKFVKDRPGHDLRYAIDSSKISKYLSWNPIIKFDDGIQKTVAWYIANKEWWEKIRSGKYKGERLGNI